MKCLIQEKIAEKGQTASITTKEKLCKVCLVYLWCSHFYSKVFTIFSRTWHIRLPIQLKSGQNGWTQRAWTLRVLNMTMRNWYSTWMCIQSLPAADFQPCLAKCFLLSGGILEERGIVLNQQRTLSRNAKKSKLQRIVAIYLCRNLHFLMQNQRPQN